MSSVSGYRVRRWKRPAAFVGVAALALTLTGTSLPAMAQEKAPVDRRGTTVKVGVIHQEQGPIVFPEFLAATEAMVAYFNAELGGVGRRPMAIALCTTDETAESAVACAEQLAAAGDVHLVIENTNYPTAIADVLTAAGKPLLAAGVDITNMLREGVFVMEPGSAGIAQALFANAASDVGVTHFTVFHADDPAIAGFLPVIELIAVHAGLTIDAFVPLGFEGDLTGPISAGIADASDGLAFIIAPQQCVPAGEALQALAIDLPVVAAELCLTEEVVSTGVIDGWYFGTQSVAPVVDGGYEARKIRRILTTYGDNADPGGFAGYAVGVTWIARDVLKQAGAGSATDESVQDVLSTYCSADVLGFDKVSCPGPGSFIGACNTSTLMVQVRDSAIYNAGGFVESDFSIFEELLGGP